jgi:hypothetical protein
MLKLLLCLFFGVATAVVLLQLREQHLNLTFQTNELHNQIEATQAQLWTQQLSIAVCTAPNAIAAEMKDQESVWGNSKTPAANPSDNPTAPADASPAPAKHSWVDDTDSDASAAE